MPASAGGVCRLHTCKLRPTPHGQSFVHVLDRLDEVRLAKNEIDRFRFIDSYGYELHVELLVGPELAASFGSFVGEM
jgi:hypothetical protein